VIGIVLARDVLRALLEHGAIDLASLTRPALVLPDSAGVLAAMEALRRSPVPLAVVVDEFGSFAGVLTPTDILEAIAGEFPDADETVAEAQAQPDGTLLVDAAIDIHHLGSLLGLDLADAAGRYATLAGFLLARFGRLPRTGEAIEAAGRRFEVETADSHRIVRVRIASPPAESQVQAKA
jgi:CBS domain containing-hemolysin-like protein